MDKRAQKILFDTYWSSAGWHRTGLETPSENDYAYAKSKRVMFDPQRLDHADAVERLLNATAKLSRWGVADAFLASLSTRRLDWRSALGSYAVFQHLHQHAAAGALHSCSICGADIKPAVQDLNLLNFKRLKWGGVRHSDVLYAIIPAASRSLPHRHFIDMAYPACWWGRDTGLNSLKLQEYFGHAF